MIDRPIIKWDGKPVSVAGCYSGMPIEVYHSANAADGPSISSSGLRTIFQKSPLDYWVGSPLNPYCEGGGDTEAFRIGRAVHHLALGEADFNQHFVVRPDTYVDTKTGEAKKWTGQSNVCKAWIADQTKTILTSENLIDIQGMCGVLPWQEGKDDSGLANHSLIRHGRLLDGLIEHSFFWKDTKTGVWLRSRPDAIPTGGEDNADLKTTLSVDYRDIEQTIGGFRYDMQAALARMAMREVWGVELRSFAFPFVMKKPPYTVTVTEMRPADMDEAEKDIRVAIDTFARCLETDKWLGPSGSQSDAVFVGLSTWRREAAIARREFLKKELGS